MANTTKKGTKTVAFRATEEDQRLIARAQQKTGIQGVRDLMRHALVKLLDEPGPGPAKGGGR